MNMINFINKFIEQLTKCGGCYTFGSFVEDDSTFNKFQLTEENKCCTILFVKYIGTFDSLYETTVAGNSRYFKKGCDTKLSIYLLNSASAEYQFHNETQHYPINESRWEKNIQPKLDCVSCMDLNPCELLSDDYDFIAKSVYPVYALGSNFFEGVRIDLTIRKYAST